MYVHRVEGRGGRFGPSAQDCTPVRVCVKRNLRRRSKWRARAGCDMIAPVILGEKTRLRRPERADLPRFAA